MILSVMGSSSWKSFFQLVCVLLIFVFVLGLTYVCTRWIARYQKGVTANKNIKVIETFRVTNNKFIQIIEIGRVYKVIAVCKDTITLLGELNEDDLTWLPEEETQVPSINESFQDVLQKLKDKLPRK